MHAFLIVGSTIKNREEKVSELLTSLDIAESQEVKTSKKHLISTIRSINKRLLIPAVDPSRNRSVIIYDANLLTQDAANAFLKTLEEPPQKTIFILTAEQKESVLETISSRAQTIELTGEGINIDDIDLQRAQEVFEKLSQGKLGDKMKVLDEIAGREEGKAFLLEQIVYTRALLNKNTKTGKPNTKVVTLLERLIQTQQDLDANVNTKIALCDLLLNFPKLL